MKVFIFDFDGTIAIEDTTDLILELPGEDQIWQIEQEWATGALTSYPVSYTHLTLPTTPYV